MKTNFLPGKALQIITILLMLPILAFGQMQSFVSKVVDAETGEALPYVSVYAKQNRTGTLSNAEVYITFLEELFLAFFTLFCKKKGKDLVSSIKTPTFAAQKGPDGGIGRRAGLKHQWGNPCRFDPGSGYRKGVSESPEAPFFFEYFSRTQAMDEDFFFNYTR